MGETTEKEIAHIEGDIKEIKGKIGEIRNILVGNGRIGLVAKTEILWRINIFLIVAVLGETILVIRLLLMS